MFEDEPAVVKNEAGGGHLSVLERCVCVCVCDETLWFYSTTSDIHQVAAAAAHGWMEEAGRVSPLPL